MSSSYAAVVGGKLKLKKAGAPTVSAPSGPRPAAGMKRPAPEPSSAAHPPHAAAHTHTHTHADGPSGAADVHTDARKHDKPSDDVAGAAVPAAAASVASSSAAGAAESAPTHTHRDTHSHTLTDGHAGAADGGTGTHRGEHVHDAASTGTDDDVGRRKSARMAVDGRTPAQVAFEAAQAKRRASVVSRMVSASHREKVDALNEKLSKMPEHHDIPKISYAGIG